MIPTWKLKREVRRVTEQLLGVPRWLRALPRRLNEPRRRRAHDAARGTFRVTEGDAPMLDRVAIYMVYQPDGILPSTVDTCRWLTREGYAPLIVSNAALDQASRQALAPVSWRIVERPHFGRDFGGYRDGILLLRDWNIAPAALIVMNDSVWIPMVPDLMARVHACAKAADIVGLLQDEKVRHDRHGGQPTNKRHIESYFFHLNQTALSHPAFVSFWRDYRMTEHKPDIIKHGEIGFSRRMEAGGLRLAALTNRAEFLSKIAEFTDDELYKTLQHAAYADHDVMLAGQAVQRLIFGSEEWRAAAMAHIRRAVNRKRFNATFPYATDRIFGTMFMKKSKDPIFIAMRHQYVKAVTVGDIKASSEKIIQEIKTLDS